MTLMLSSGYQINIVIFSGCRDMEKFGKHSCRVVAVEVKLQFRRTKWRNGGGSCKCREVFPDIYVSERRESK